MPEPTSYLLTDLTGGSHMTAAKIERLAERVRRLSPSRHNPEQFHSDKSEIAAELRRLAREIAA